MKAWDDAWKTESGYFDRAAIDRHFTAFQDGPGGFHWQVLARLRENG
jgi:hypothetical protein